MIPSRVHIICVVSYVLQLPVEFADVCERVHPRVVSVCVFMFVIYLFVHIVRLSANCAVIFSFSCFTSCQFLYFSYIVTMERVNFFFG
jgi:hypothetical protein